MSENPSTVFYWNDWEREPGLRLCSLAAQGLWMRCLCLMARSDPPGYLVVGTKPCTVRDLASLVGNGEETVERLIEELEVREVFSRTRKGTIYNRRMARRAKLTAKRRESGILGGMAKALKDKAALECAMANAWQIPGKRMAPLLPLPTSPPDSELEKTPQSATETTSLSQTAPQGANGRDKPKSQDKGTRLAEDWRPSEKAISYCLNDLKCPVDILNREFDSFMDWGLSATGPASRKRNWDRAFINWIRRVMNGIREQEARERRWAEQRSRH